MLANMRYDAVVRGSWQSHCNLANALERLMRAEDETCSKPALDVPCLDSLSSATRYCHRKRTKYVGHSSCSASSPTCEMKNNWSERAIGCLCTCILLFSILSKCFVMADIAFTEYFFRLKSILHCHSSLGTRNISCSVSDALQPASAELTTTL